MKRENNNNSNLHNGMLSSPLKVHRVSHAIKRSYSLPSSSSRSVPSLVIPRQKANNNQNNHRGPVIIYTHSPKVIHTNPRDFMSLVQKLTGMSSQSKDVNVSISPKNIGICGSNVTNDRINNDKMIANIMTANNCISDNNSSSTSSDDNESSSVITEENGSSGIMGDQIGYLNPCMEAGIFGPPSVQSLGPLVPDLPFLMSNGPNLYCKSGDPPPVYDHLNYNFACYNQIS